jgi:GNAT superfamily N-acetyltransferase
MISIRKADENDAQAVWDIRNAAINSRCTGYYPPELLEIWTAGEMTEQFVKAVVDKFYVATLDDHVVGTGMIDLETGEVGAMFVHPSRMGTGLGRRIVTYLEKLALEAGLAHLSLESTLNAAPFYRACGFVGETAGKYESPRGISLDCIPMKKALRHVTGSP